MERELFDWTGWDGDQECMTFYDITLKKQIGKFAPGTKFASAVLLYDTGDLQFYNNGETRKEHHYEVTESIFMGEFKLRLEVV